jgi:hypothetical protein
MLTHLTIEQRNFEEWQKLQSLLGIGSVRFRPYDDSDDRRRFNWVREHLVETLQKLLPDAAKLADKTRDPELLKKVEWVETALKAIYATNLEIDEVYRQKRSEELQRKNP